ncbi:MAG: alpha/beta hydrolase [Pyrinomonadaceae bacterium]|nr:alpha/beta hydrolase [Pyrinomonadaceae bacterium]
MISKLKHTLKSNGLRQRSRLCLTLIALALTLAGAPAVVAQKAPTSEVKSRHATLDGARINYQSYGKGREALVLVHGWTCNLDYWRDQVPDFAKRNRVIALDLPGHGQSDKPEVAYSMDLFARAIDAVMRDAKVDRAVLVGHSMGTPVVRQFYRKYPQKTLAIVIVDGGLRPFGDKKMRDGFVAAFRAPNYKEAGKQMFAGMAGPGLPAETQERIRTSFLNTPQYVLVSAMEGMNDETIYGPDKISVPVLAILAKSPFWPADTEQFLRSIAANLDYDVWDGVGHFLMMEKPKQFNDEVIVFLDKNALLK